jgi:hypothetical protein
MRVLNDSPPYSVRQANQLTVLPQFTERGGPLSVRSRGVNMFDGAMSVTT